MTFARDTFAKLRGGANGSAGDGPSNN
jgi:hypothetical protein